MSSDRDELAGAISQSAGKKPRSTVGRSLVFRASVIKRRCLSWRRSCCDLKRTELRKGGTMNRVWSHAFVAAALAASSVGISAAAGQDVGRDGLQLFAERVAAYAELHQRVDAVFPPWKATDDVDSIFRR